jgi:hypothetical protein
MICPEYQRLLGNGINAWDAYKTTHEAPPTDCDQETIEPTQLESNRRE